jgi:serine/threonine protein kinase
MATTPSTKIRGWDTLEKLGEGGQSEVFKVRRPERRQQRFELMKEFSKKVLLADEKGFEAVALSVPSEFGNLAEIAYEYARPDNVSELGALKLFKMPKDGKGAEEAFGRLRNEISLLQQGKSGLVKVIEADEREAWMVTEFMPLGTLEKHPSKYKGNAYGALKAFRSLVETVASLHKDGIVHRDIKPANVFLAENDQLILGDFGIVYLPQQGDRLTTLNERVGPRDYMPQWGDLGQRLENVQPNFDVYMLGKLLWCMVSGRIKLPREYHTRPGYDVTVLFRDDPNMRKINEILEQCVVEEPDQCLKSAQELLGIVDESLAVLVGGVPMLDGNGTLILPCRICGKGYYREHYPEGHFRLPAYDAMGRSENPIHVRIFVCNVCTHYELFAPNFPNEAAQKGWKSWRPN